MRLLTSSNYWGRAMKRKAKKKLAETGSNCEKSCSKQTARFLITLTQNVYLSHKVGSILSHGFQQVNGLLQASARARNSHSKLRERGGLDAVSCVHNSRALFPSQNKTCHSCLHRMPKTVNSDIRNSALKIMRI